MRTASVVSWSDQCAFHVVLAARGRSLGLGRASARLPLLLVKDMSHDIQRIEAELWSILNFWATLQDEV